MLWYRWIITLLTTLFIIRTHIHTLTHREFLGGSHWLLDPLAASSFSHHSAASHIARLSVYREFCVYIIMGFLQIESKQQALEGKNSGWLQQQTATCRMKKKTFFFVNSKVSRHIKQLDGCIRDANCEVKRHKIIVLCSRSRVTSICCKIVENNSVCVCSSSLFNVKIFQTGIPGGDLNLKNSFVSEIYF